MARNAKTAAASRSRQFGAPLVLVLLVVLAMQAPATAAGFSDDFSAGDEYVETVPTTKGPHVADGHKHHAGKRRALSGRAQSRLNAQGGDDAALLREVATSPQLGAPPRRAASAKRSGARRHTSDKGRAPGRAGVPSAAINAASSHGGGVGWLVLALFAITTVGLGAVGYQRYRNRERSR
jgi:hypothetical protein